MTLASQIVSDVETVFLNTDDFAEEITHYPLGELLSETTITAIVDLTDEIKSPASGGSVKEDPRGPAGQRIYRNCRLHVAATLSIDDRDKFLINDQTWSVKRIAGRDSGMLVVWLTRAEPIAARGPRIRKE